MKKFQLLPKILGVFTLIILLLPHGFASAQASVKISLLGAQNQNDTLMIKALIDAYTAQHPNVTFDVEVPPGTGTEVNNLIKTRLATGDMNDIFYYNSGSLLQALHPADTLVDLSQEAFMANIADSFKPTVSQDKGVYGVPVGYAAAGGILYNKKVYDKLGLKVPKSWAEFEANNDKIKAAGIPPVLATYGDDWTSQLFVLAFVMLMLALLSAMVGAAPAQQAGLPTWPTNPNWQALVPGPSSDTVKATAISSTRGTVSNAAALINSGTATLTNSGSAIVLDFGHEVGGTPFITASSGSGTIRISTSEALPFLTSGGNFVNDNGSQINLTVSGAGTRTGSLRGGFRFMAIELTTSGTVSLTAAGVNFKAFRATSAQYQGWFMSNDNQLNSMWYAGAYTAQMDMVPAGVSSCFSVPVIFDGAKRDRAIWSGDLMVSDPAAWLPLGTNSAPFITGAINAFMNLQQTGGRLHSAVGFQGCGGFNYAVTYSNYAAIIAIQYYRYSGDTSFITPLLSRLRNATTFSAGRLDGNGLMVTDDNDYWQTSQTGEVTEYSLAYYELLQNMIWLEGRIGSAANVTDYTNKATALRNAINSRLWSASAHLYVHSNTDTARFPLDANMNAIRLGVAPANEVAGILSFFRSHWQAHGDSISQPSPSMADPFGHTIEPLNNTWELMARMEADDVDGAMQLMRNLWGLQVDPNSGFYTGTFWEFVLANGLPSRGFDSLAHAWGAGPTQVLTESVLGVTPVNQGYSTWQVKPHPGNLTWAEGQIPTGSASLTVRWAADSTGQFHMQVVSPSGKSGQVWVPLATSSASTAVMSGSATLLQRSGLYDIYQVGAGVVEFSSVPNGGGSPTFQPPTNTPTGGITWTLCAQENGTCTFSGTMTVRYGANNSWFYRVATNSIACNNATFGDPIRGTAKACYYSPNGPTPTPTP